jgi:superfamily II RNA helicase
LIKTLTNNKCSEFFQKKSQENQEDLKKTIQRLESEVKRLKKENFELKEEIRSLTRDSRDSFMSGKVFASCLENLIDIQEFWHIMNPNNLPLITRQELKRAVRGLGIQIKDKKIDFFFERLSQGSPGINEDQFLERIIKFKPSVVVTLNDLKFALKSMKPLKNTINLEDLLLKTLKHPKISLKETFKGFKSIFQDIPDENLEIVVRGIFSFESQLKTIEIPKKLKNFLENQDLFN